MKKLTYTLNAICFLAILLNTLSMHGMERRTNHSNSVGHSSPYNFDIAYGSFGIIPEYTRSNKTQLNAIVGTIYEEQASQAEEYNQNNSLLGLPKEILHQIFSSCNTESLERTIKIFMRLKTTCKNFNTLLTFETMSDFCKNYAQNNKDLTLQNIIKHINNFTYTARRLPILLLLCADATSKPEHELKYLFEMAINHTDMPMLKALFKHHAKVKLGSIFFKAKTIEMVQTFIDNRIDIHATDPSTKTNVLWYILEDQYPSAIMELYLKHGVNTRVRSSLTNSCVLHKLAKPAFICKINNVDNFLQKAILLLDAIPDMINIPDDYDKTPLDAVQAFLKEAKSNGTSPEAFEKLLTLFRVRGGFSAQELNQQTALQKQSSPQGQVHNCIICLETQENMLDVPCANSHPEHLCIACYNQLLVTSGKCPMCRNVLMK